ncbi:hypothetical protein AOQ84DRAFT_357494 [Glonium stellatum]|uniref:Uncharacterized protein n=1 Tax=Glonium stellatum TaxID=574774 RepID=A0A8E2EPF1_9PEZI|nr:hypothetical protein AOQ84DRAFT_357494 [Glonium stellatum]
MEKKAEIAAEFPIPADNKPAELATSGKTACECSCTCAHRQNHQVDIPCTDSTKGQAERSNADATNVYVEDAHRRARPRRRLSYSPVRIYSPEPLVFRGRSPSPVRRLTIEEVSSHLQLIPAVKASATKTQENVALDRSVRIVPFNCKAYVTTHAATPVDFRHWLPLLASAIPERWYKFADAKSLNLLADLLAGAPAVTLQNMLQPIENARAISLGMPAITASAALRIEPEGQEEDIPLLYLSVQQAVVGQDHYDHNEWYDRPRRQTPDMAKEGSATGTPIYRVVKCGSRQAAASRAFYTAGANGWSTIFTCVVMDKTDDEGMPSAARLFQRVKGLRALVDGTEDGKTMVFY